MKKRMNFKKAQSLCNHPLNLQGENLTHTGAKISHIGGGWWKVWGYHHSGKDVKDLGL